MIILLLVICISATVPFIKLSIKNFSDRRYPSKGLLFEEHTIKYGCFFSLFVVFGILSLIFTLKSITMFVDVSTEYVIDSKIEMYQAENSNIEKSIDSVVSAYMQHEKDTFTDLKTEGSLITLVTLFPELKADVLVQEQVELYVSNNELIKSLKEKKIEISRKRWLLYFGR